VIAQEATRPYSEVGGFSFSGPALKVAPKTAIALSLALHELATNAVKYGALSSPNGRVRLTWERSEDTITLDWRESGGPQVAPPQKEGFGSRLLGPVLNGELGAPAELDFAPTGVVCRILAPAEMD
jgi:two-component sensor histidine kinase